MARYYVTNQAAGTQQALTTSYKTQWSLTAVTGATTLRRAYIYDAIFGADGTPADNQVSVGMRRQTTVGTGTTVTTTVGQLDDADAAQLITVTVNNTIEPTTGDTVLDAGINQRASFRWVAAPGGELIVPATTTNGIGGIAKSAAYTGTVLAGVYWWE